MPDDDLDRAIDARIDAYRPDGVPAFAGLVRRKRRHDQRHAATGVVALAVVALGAVAFVGPSLAGEDRVAGQASGDGPPTPTVSLLAEESLAIEPFGYQVSPDGRSLTVAVQLAAECQSTGVADVVVSAQDDDWVTLRARVTRDPSAPAFRPRRPGCWENYLYQYTPAMLAAPLADRLVIDGFDGKVLTPAPPGAPLGLPRVRPVDRSNVVWTGATVCRTESTGSCVPLDADEANALDAVIDAAHRELADPNIISDCRLTPEDYTVLFSAPNIKPIPIVVPTACNPMRRGGLVYKIDQEVRDAVRQAYLDN